TRALIGLFSEVTVVDGSEELLNALPSAPGLTKTASLFEAYQPTGVFDTILVDHVLEHIGCPQQLLARVHQWLAPAGRAIIGVPNAKSLHRLAAVKMGLLQSPTQLNERDMALGHRRVYDLGTLRDEVQRANLKVLHEGGVFLKPVSN